MRSEDKKTDRLRVLLRQVELTAPSKEFTEEVMRETSHLNDENAPVNDPLRRVLNSSFLTAPPGNFVHQVQRALDKSKDPVMKPVITREVWIAVGIFLGVCMLLGLTYPADKTPVDTFLYFSWLAGHVITLTSAVREPLLYIEAIVVPAALLLGLEKILRRGADWRHS